MSPLAIHRVRSVLGSHRGNEQRAVFRDAQDREGFLARLGRCSQRFSLAIYAYVLMGNHYHLLVRSRNRIVGSCLEARRSWTTCGGV
jgi:REP element-mobilizing transposase RayT